MFSPLAIRIILEGAQSWEVPEDQLFAYSKVKGEKVGRGFSETEVEIIID